MERCSFSQKLQKCWYGDKWNGNILEEFSENPDIVKFSKRKPSNRNFRKLREESHTNFRLGLSVNFGTPRKVVLFSGNSGKCCSICRWKFRKSNSNFSLNWKLPRDCSVPVSDVSTCIDLVKSAGSNAPYTGFSAYSPSHGEKLDNIMARWHSECGFFWILRACYCRVERVTRPESVCVGFYEIAPSRAYPGHQPPSWIWIALGRFSFKATLS